MRSRRLLDMNEVIIESVIDDELLLDDDELETLVDLIICLRVGSKRRSNTWRIVQCLRLNGLVYIFVDFSAFQLIKIVDDDFSCNYCYSLDHQESQFRKIIINLMLVKYFIFKWKINKTERCTDVWMFTSWMWRAHVKQAVIKPVCPPLQDLDQMFCILGNKLLDRLNPIYSYTCVYVFIYVYTCVIIASIKFTFSSWYIDNYYEDTRI